MLTDNLVLEELSEGTILPVHYFDLIKRRKFLDGERLLMFAVLEDAVHSYLADINDRSRVQRARFADVRRWFYAPSDHQALFAFESICGLLAIDAGIFRKRLGSLSLRDLAPSAPARSGRSPHGHFV